MHPEIHTLKYRPDIDGLRALAVLAVVLFHTGLNWLPGGFIGVDIFFVISGYLISGIIIQGLEKGSFSFATFYTRRVKRIFPALVLVMAASWAAGMVLLLPDELMSLGRHILAGATFSNNFQLWSETGYFDTEAELKPLLHLWSLGIEEQFYVLWPLFLFLIWKFRLRAWPPVTAVLLLSLVLNLYWTPRDAATAFFLPHTRFWELALGAWLALAQTHRQSWPGRVVATLVAGRLRLNAVAATGMALLALGFFAITDEAGFPGAWALLPTMGALLLIMAGPTAWINRKLLANPLAVFIGLISYPLYLWHWPLFSFAEILSNGEAGVSVKLALAAAALALAWLTYRYVENPVRFGEIRLSSGRALNVWLLSVLLVVVGALGERTYDKDGAPFGGSNQSPFAWPNSLKRQAACSNSYGYEGSFCLQSDDSKRLSVALIGDSHANQYYPGLQSHLARRGESLLHLGEAGCLPYLGVDTVSAERKRDCQTYTSRALQIVLNDPGIKTVVLASRGPSYVSGRGWGKVDDKSLRLLDVLEPAEPDSNRAVFERALERTVAAITASGRKLIFILDNPELGFRPQECHSPDGLLFKRKLRAPCAVPRSLVDERQRAYRESVFRVLGRHPEVWVVDPMLALCDSDYCHAQNAEGMLYRDDDHFSMAGSRYVVSRLAP